MFDLNFDFYFITLILHMGVEMILKNQSTWVMVASGTHNTTSLFWNGTRTAFLVVENTVKLTSIRNSQYAFSDRERIPNGPRTDPERTPNGPRTDPERIPHEPRMDPVRPSNRSRTDPEPTLRGARADPERTPNEPRIGFERTPNRSRMDPGATKSSPKHGYVASKRPHRMFFSKRSND